MQTNHTNINLKTLIGHSEWVDANSNLDTVHQSLSTHEFDFVAVLDNSRFIGMCSRAKIGMLLGHRYGHSLYSRHKIRDYLRASHLVVTLEDPITRVLSDAFNREEEYFYDDIVLTDKSGVFLGFIFMKTLVTLQNRFFLENIDKLEKKQLELNQKNQQMENNLMLARQLQQAILPKEHPCFPARTDSHNSMMRFYHYYQSADLLGGDFFHILPLSDYRAGVFICDVVGHGVGSALVTAMMRALVEIYRPVAEQPGKLLSQMNQKFNQMLSQYPDSIFATAVYCIFDVEQGHYSLSAAGHDLPIQINRAENTCRSLEVNSEVIGPPLGIVPFADYGTYDDSISENDLFFFYTDGLYEVFNEQNEMFGEARLTASLEKNLDRPPTLLFEAVLSELKDFSENGEFRDDMCMVGVEVRTLCKQSSLYVMFRN
jgi:serine phosphatase RsbU (regulator of sigma subunit)